jgi:hypothetical protein
MNRPLQDNQLERTIPHPDVAPDILDHQVPHPHPTAFQRGAHGQGVACACLAQYRVEGRENDRPPAQLDDAHDASPQHDPSRGQGKAIWSGRPRSGLTST